MTCTLDLFPSIAPDPKPTLSSAAEGDLELGQVFTPGFVAAALYERTFAHLGARDRVLDPTCGTGRLLAAVPRRVDAIGVELDASLAAAARTATGREVICGDFLSVDVGELRPSAVFANPPFDARFIDRMLDRVWSMLPDGGLVGAILPSHYWTSIRSTRLAERWSYTIEMLPKDTFSRMRRPAVWAVLERSRRHVVVGIALYRDVAAVRAMRRRYERLLRTTTVEPWRETVLTALADLGGRATLPSLYRAVEGKRTNLTRFYREKVRQTLQRHAVRVGPGVWELAA